MPQVLKHLSVDGELRENFSQCCHIFMLKNSHKTLLLFLGHISINWLSGTNHELLKLHLFESPCLSVHHNHSLPNHILDDLMFANRGDHILVVVNAACKDADIAHLRKHLEPAITVKSLDNRALLAIQGPAAEVVMAEYHPRFADMRFMDVDTLPIAGAECWVSRSGYTGEDGYEISIPVAAAETVARALLAHDDVEFIGLGARDSLRLEAGLSLYGHELDTSHSPVESSLNWALSTVRRLGGEREGNYLGDNIILKQLENGSDTKVVGLLPEGRMPVRDGAIIQDENGAQVGYVTSGGFGPTLNKPISIARLETKVSNSQSKLFALVREKKIAVEIIKLPFVKHNYYRG